MTREVLLGYVGKRVMVCHDSAAADGAVTGVLDEVTASIAWFVGNIGVPIGRITSIQVARPAGAREGGEG